ncbi:MAG TPA: hypothetical protein VF144_17445 [Chitinophagaceae bacterium]
MPDSVTFIKSNPLLPAEDYNAMRKQGFRSIERMGSHAWTEYNNSDPGITILEALCYAITDLAYRTGFEVKDLLAPEKLTEDTWKNIFYTARQILHNNPLTITDYRKIVIDVKGVRNAWLEPSKDYEVPIWVDYNYYEQKEDPNCGCEDKEVKSCYGKLSLQPMDELTVEKRNQQRRTIIADRITENQAKITNKTSEIATLTTRLQHENTDVLAKKNLRQQIKKLKRQVKKLKNENNRLEEEKKVLAGQQFTPSKIIELEGLYNVLVEYEEDVLEDEQRDEVRKKVVDRLNNKRNLCEDFLSVNAVDYEDFGIGASVAIEEYADPDAILAQMFFTIFKYFTPSVQFYTIPQMMAKGYEVDEIFEGPALQHGFMDTKELEQTDLFRDIRLSDIINDLVTEDSIDEKIKKDISGIKGIKAITYLHLPFKDPGSENSGDNYFTKWIKELTDERKLARIQPSMSSIIFCKEHDVTTYNTGSDADRRPGRMLKMFNDLKKQERKYKLEKHDGEFNDFNIPAGENMELQDYYPVTYSLPMYYGVSDRAGLPLDASEKRQIQALQLKGYMLFFEQLLSDYLVQLDHLRDLFSFDDVQEKTYFTKALTKEISDLQSLIIDHADRGAKNFDDIVKDFTAVLQNLVEPPAVFNKRRNSFLDHMLARFSENLEEYESISRWLTPAGVDKRLIQDKARILKDGNYKKISTERGKAYNYSLQKVWNTDNVSGAETRISGLLGFRQAKRRSLSPEFIVVEPVMVTEDKTKPPAQKKNKKGQGLNVIKFFDPENSQRVILTSAEVIDGCCIEELITEILAHADDHHHIKFHDEVKQKSRIAADITGSYWFEICDDTDPEKAVVLAKSEKFDSKEHRNEAYHTLKSIMEIINNDEGLHLLEHLLLRPKFDTVLDEVDQPVPVSFPEICLDLCDLGRGLDKRIQPPGYRKRITRIPPDKCYDKMPWVLEYLRLRRQSEPPKYESILFKQVFKDDSDPVLLSFRRYESMAKRIKDLAEYGSEKINYIITDILVDPDDRNSIKYGFTINDEDGVALAQSPYVFNQRKNPDDPPVENDIDEEINNLMDYFEFELDLYCDPDPCDNNEDPFSFRCTIVLPCWPKRLRDATFRNLVEKTIHSELPAHIHPNIKWVGISEMKRFEKVYFDWLAGMAHTEMPAYEFVNPLVDVLNTLKPCGCCHDECHDISNESKNDS